MVKVVVADPIHKDAIAYLKEHGCEVKDLSSDKEKLPHELKDAAALIVRSATKVNEKLLAGIDTIKIVGRSGVGLDNIDLAYCKSRGIKVVNSPEGPTQSVAELALGLMIVTARKFGIVYPGTKEGKWPKKQKGMELFGKTLGIIGSGAIGGTLARYAICMGMNVVAYDIVEYPELKALDNFDYVDLDTLFAVSDVISIHVPLLPATHHMVNSSAFDKMKKGVIIINTSRGGIIDEMALLDAINSGKVAGAALDVFEKEPVDHLSPLVSHPLVITTPHIGAQTPEASRRNSMIIAEKIISELF